MWLLARMNLQQHFLFVLVRVSMVSDAMGNFMVAFCRSRLRRLEAARLRAELPRAIPQWLIDHKVAYQEDAAGRESSRG